MKNPTVSVVMSVYNEERYLTKALESVFWQDFEDYEIIAVNDGSTDGSESILERYAGREKRMRVVSHPNQGLTRSLNVGLKLARGKYVARQDSDDVSARTRLSRQVEYLEANRNVVVCWAWFKVIDQYGDVLGVMEFPTTDRAIRRKLLRSNVFPHSGAFYRRKEIINLGGYREVFKKAQDLDLWLRVMDRYKLGAIPETLVSYRYREGSITVDNSSDQRIYHDLAVECYFARKSGNEPQILENFPEKRQKRSGKYSRNELYLANLYLRSGKNKKARWLFKGELEKGFDKKLFIKYLMCSTPIRWSWLFRYIC